MVTLDGSNTEMLVPTLYLARANAGDVCEDGEYSHSLFHQGKSGGN
jgi:hypothetical protein